MEGRKNAPPGFVEWASGEWSGAGRLRGAVRALVRLINKYANITPRIDSCSRYMQGSGLH